MFEKLGQERNTSVPATESSVAKVDKYLVNDEGGRLRVGLKVYFPSFNASEWFNFTLIRKDGTENRKGNAYLVTMFNKLGIPTQSARDLDASFKALVDNWWEVSVKVNGDWKNLEFLSSATPPAREEKQEESFDDSSDDLPF